MPETFLKIASTTVGTAVSSITFSSIPANFTDLVLKTSIRSTGTGGSGFDDYLNVRFNGDTGNNYKNIYLQAYSSSAASGGIGNAYSRIFAGLGNGSSSTANSFSSNDFYLTNYTASEFKAINIDGFLPNNSTSEYVIRGIAGQWLSTSAINSINIYLDGANIAQYSTATLYGIVKS